MIGAFKDSRTAFSAAANAAIAVPTFDGALKANQKLEEAETVLECDAPEDLGDRWDRDLFSPTDRGLSELDGWPSDGTRRFDRPISALAGLPDGGFAVALAGKEVRVFSEPSAAKPSRGVRDRPQRGQRARAGADGDADRDRRIGDARRRSVGVGPAGARSQRLGCSRSIRRPATATHSPSGLGYAFGAAHGRRRGSGQRELAPSRDRRRRGTARPDRAAASAGLSVAAVAAPRGGGYWLTAFVGAKPAHRVHAARAGLPEANDGGDRSAILDRAAPALRPVVQGTAAGRAHQDHGRRQALGAAALLRPRYPPRRRWRAALFAAQPRRRRQSWRRRGGRTRGRPGHDREGPRADLALPIAPLDKEFGA